MLPDYPNLKQKIAKQLVKMLKIRFAQHNPLVANLKRTMVVEGASVTFHSDEGWTENLPFQKHGTSMSLTAQEVLSADADRLAEELDQAAGDLARQADGHLLERMDEICEASGNIVRTAGRGMDNQAFFEMMEKLVIDFDANGEPIMPSIVSSRAGVAQAIATLQEIHSTPELRRRLEQLVEQKRIEWRDREANRQLVG